MISIEALKALVAAGATAEMIVTLIEAQSRVTSVTIERKREQARIRKQNQREKSRVTSVTRDGENRALFLKTIKEEEKKERKKEPPRKVKHALPDDWRPSNSLTLKGEEELEKMRDWARANAIRKADWPATWRNWVRRVGGGCEVIGNPAPDLGFYAEFGSKEQEAWETYAKKNGKSYPRDKRGGWTFPTRWPPQEARSDPLDERQPDARADTG